MADTRTEIGLRVSVDELALLCALVGEHVRAGGGRDAGELLRRLETARSRPSRARAKGMRATVLRVDGTQSVEEFADEPGLEWLQHEVGGIVQVVTLGHARVVCNVERGVDRIADERACGEGARLGARDCQSWPLACR